MRNNPPEKFLNEDGTLNAESLLKSYLELEKKIGAMVSIPADDSDNDVREKFYRAIGVPENADGYPNNPMFEGMPDIKEKFREMGLTAKQAESVCEMAADILSPAIVELLSSQHESNCMGELRQFFGSDDKMQKAFAEINDYAETHLSPEAFDALSSSAEGIKAIYGMMQSKEPTVMAIGAANEALSEGMLRQMMKDPKYWRDRDEEFTRKIESGFKKLFK